MAKKLECNEDLVRDLMNYSPYGPLCQAFVMTAIDKYAQQVIAATPEELESGLVPPAMWKLLAEDIKQRMDAFYSRHDAPTTTEGEDA